MVAEWTEVQPQVTKVGTDLLQGAYDLGVQEERARWECKQREQQARQPVPVPADSDGLPRDDFAALLRAFRERIGRSRNALAHEVGVDPSYLTRIEHGDREPPRAHIVEALTRALRLSVPERNRLLVAAGYAPLSVVQLGAWDDSLQSVADVLNDLELTIEERNEFRGVVQTIARRYSRAAL